MQLINRCNKELPYEAFDYTEENDPVKHDLQKNIILGNIPHHCEI